MAGLRPAGASGAQINPIVYHPLNSIGKDVIERQKMWYLKTMFQRSKIVVTENRGKKCKSFDTDAREFAEDVVKVCRSCRESLSMITKVCRSCRESLLMMSRRCCWFCFLVEVVEKVWWWSRKFVEVVEKVCWWCRESLMMMSRRCCWFCFLVEVVEKVFTKLSRECNHVKGRFRKNRLWDRKVVCEDVFTAGRRPAGACGAHTNSIWYYPLNSIGKYGIERQKKWYLKTMFQRSKIVVTENSGENTEKSRRWCEEVWWSCRESFHEVVERVQSC